MNPTAVQSRSQSRFELRYVHLVKEGRGYAFPCDEQGHVDMDGLSEASRVHYLYARAVVGLELSLPTVVPAGA